MDVENLLKAQLVQEIEKLPEDRLQEVLDFVGYLMSKERKIGITKLERELDPAKDPILKFIGGVSHGSLAKKIDTDLYGEQE